ncbi:hypothetical protein V1477_005316 [Vespula maculifrons]|uniref:Uncharacterized protein n=2 Tax=Vespula TaxID=7451 RepID=A0A834KK60_VESVU|nr:hypothetical protein HZH66_001949 [Vespula vulgaris]
MGGCRRGRKEFKMELAVTEAELSCRAQPVRGESYIYHFIVTFKAAKDMIIVRCFELSRVIVRGRPCSTNHKETEHSVEQLISAIWVETFPFTSVLDCTVLDPTPCRESLLEGPPFHGYMPISACHWHL